MRIVLSALRAIYCLAGLVESAWVGRESLYEFRPKPIEGIKTYLDHVSRQWDEALSRWKSLGEC
jgi:hypothetical protein